MKRPEHLFCLLPMGLYHS